MQIIGDFFNILLFVTMTGSLLTLLSCLLGRVLRLPLSLWVWHMLCGRLHRACNGMGKLADSPGGA